MKNEASRHIDSARRPNSGTSRRVFLKCSGVMVGSVALGVAHGRPPEASTGDSVQVATNDLPKGSSPVSLTFPHFPDRLHAFVWRNWPLVPIKRMARVVRAQPSEVERIGKAMGLQSVPRISPDRQKRAYITIIKRNWHLLPYEQLLELLGWTPERLAFTLREDDFLFIKLGGLKPNCEPLVYERPEGPVLRHQREIGERMREITSAHDSRQHEPLFAFVESLSKSPSAPTRAWASAPLKFCHSYFATYGDPLLDPGEDPYPEGYLARLAEVGVNGVWLQALLYKLAAFPWDPKRSHQYETRLANLRAIVKRAARHGARVFLYLNEPRSMPLSFFQEYPHLRGVVEGDHGALCSSVTAVQEFIINSVASVCQAVPDLGGFLSITASENLTNCWSHGGGAGCPRCSKRSAAEVVAEVNSLFLKGIRKAGAQARLLAWDWGWQDDWAGEVIRQLPDGVELMSVSEWRLPIERGGIKTEVGEYSISAVGPGPRAREHWTMARDRGLQTVAKVQAGNTWELSAMPWIPAVENVARHAENLRRYGVGGFMLGWTLGGYPSLNLEVFSETLASGSAKEAMLLVAERHFGFRLAPAVVRAWQEFSAAFREFPFHIGVVYSGPQQLGPANLLWEQSTGYHASMVGYPYDDLDSWRSVYPEETFIQQFDRVAAGFARAVKDLRGEVIRVGKVASEVELSLLERECRIAEACAIHFRSVANQARFVAAREGLKRVGPQDNFVALKTSLETVLRDEIDLARRLFGLQSIDSRIGFEASNQYFYVPIDLVEKILNCQYLLEHWLPQIGRA